MLSSYKSFELLSDHYCFILEGEMKKWTILLLSGLLVLLTLAACASASSRNNVETASRSMQSMEYGDAIVESEGALPAAPAAAPMMEAPSVAAPAAPAEEAKGGGYNASETKRIVIKNATLSIAVKDPQTSMARVGKMAEDMGGFIVNTNVEKYTSRSGMELPRAYISVRVPAEQLTEAVDKIKAEVQDPATDILVDNITGSDVTKEYTDLQSRLTNQQKAADKLDEIMAKAEKTEDVMNVYSRLMEVNEQIEVLKGQIKYYDEASSMSEISVTIQSVEVIAPIEVGGWKPEGIARDAVQALIDALQGIGTLTIWFFIFLLPILIIFAIPVVLFIIIIRAIIKAASKSKKPKTPPAPPVQPQ